MYRWNGPYYRGAMEAHRAQLRWEAEDRNARTKKERTRVFREGHLHLRRRNSR